MHLPGYGHEMSAHPELVAMGYNVLHVSPLGYASPSGPQLGRMRDGIWPVLPETVDSGGEGGYAEWFVDCLVAVGWALGRAEVAAGRLSLFGTSQGGGAALLLVIGLLWSQRRASRAALAHSRDMDARRRKRRVQSEEPTSTP